MSKFPFRFLQFYFLFALIALNMAKPLQGCKQNNAYEINWHKTWKWWHISQRVWRLRAKLNFSFFPLVAVTVGREGNANNWIRINSSICYWDSQSFPTFLFLFKKKNRHLVCRLREIQNILSALIWHHNND